MKLYIQSMMLYDKHFFTRITDISRGNLEKDSERILAFVAIYKLLNGKYAYVHVS